MLITPKKPRICTTSNRGWAYKTNTTVGKLSRLAQEILVSLEEHIAVSGDPNMPKTNITKGQRKRFNKKMAKINALQKVLLSSSTHYVVGEKVLTNTKRYYSGNANGLVANLPRTAATKRNTKKEAKNPNKPKKAFQHSATKNLEVTDTVDGAHCVDDNGRIIWTLIPRAYTLASGDPNVNALLGTLNVINSNIVRECHRGDNIHLISEDPPEAKSRYTSAGCAANLGATGTTHKRPEIPEEDWKRLLELSCHVHYCAYGYMPSDTLQRISSLHRILELMNFDGETCTVDTIITQIWNSMALGKNNSPNSHKDKDVTSSAVAVLAPPANGESYVMDEPIAHYFVFPTIGKSVALRGGDVLLFDPSYFHSLSTRTDHFANIDTHCLSMYLNTATTSGNDKTRELTELQKGLIEYIANNPHNLGN
jgi:hypothetical protein